MNAIVEILTGVGIFAAGLVARLGIVLALMVVLLVPVLAIAGAMKLGKSAGLRMAGYRNAGGLRFRNGLLYAPGHTWVASDGNRVRVGLDDLAQRILPWTVAVKLGSSDLTRPASSPSPEPSTMATSGTRSMRRLMNSAASRTWS